MKKKKKIFTVDIETQGLHPIIPIMPMEISDEEKRKKFREFLNSVSNKRGEGQVISIGIDAPMSDACETYRRRIEAGLDQPTNGEFYTKQDMINFANKAIYAYIGNALIVDSRLKLNTDWIKDNLPTY